MQLTLLKSKLHNLCVTAAELEYEGSIGLSGDLLAAAGFVEYEQVHIWNITRGTRLVTYAMLHRSTPARVRRASTAPPRTWPSRATASSLPPSPG